MNEVAVRFLATNFAGTMGRQLCGAALALAITTLTARLFGPTGSGVFALVLLLPTAVSTILSLGISAANVYLIGSGASAVRQAVRANVHLSFWLAALGLLSGGWLISTEAATLFPGVPERLLWLALPIFPLVLIGGFLGSIAQALENFRVYNHVLLVQPALMVTGLGAMAAAGSKSLHVLVALQLATQVISTVVAAIAVYRILPKEPDHSRADSLDYCRKALSYGWKAHVGGLLAFLNYKADIFLVNFFLTPAAAGLYVIAVSLGEKLWMVSTAASTVLLPRLSQMANAEEARKSLTQTSTRIVLLVTCAGGITLAACAYPIVHLLFGKEFERCIVPLLILLPGMVVLAAARVLANDLAARGRPEINMYLSMLTLTVNLAANVALIPAFGLLGAAAATTVAYVFCATATLAAYTRVTGSSWSGNAIPKLSDVHACLQFFADFGIWARRESSGRRASSQPHASRESADSP